MVNGRESRTMVPIIWEVWISDGQIMRVILYSRHLLRGPILLFWHTKFWNVGVHPLRISAPPPKKGNRGSATELVTPFWLICIRASEPVSIVMVSPCKRRCWRRRLKAVMKAYCQTGIISARSVFCRKGKNYGETKTELAETTRSGLCMHVVGYVQVG